MGRGANQQSSALLYGPAAATPSRRPRNAEPSGPPGSGRLIALKRGEGTYWEVGWIGSELSVTVYPEREGRQALHLWCQHRRFRRNSNGESLGSEPILFSEDMVHESFHLSWTEIPGEVQELIRECTQEVPPARMNGSNDRPLNPY